MSKNKKTGKAPTTSKRPKPTQTHQGGKQPVAAPVIPEALQTPEFAVAWADWQRWHAETGTALTPDDAARQLELLARLGPDAAVADIRKTMTEHVPAPPSTPTVVTPLVENEAPAAEDIVEPATSTPVNAADAADTVNTMPNKVMANEVMANEVQPPAMPGTEAIEAEVPAVPPAVLPPAEAAANDPPATPAPPRTRGRAAQPAGQLSAIDAAAQVLAAAGQPLTCQQMIEVMATQGLWSSPKGKTPAGTLYSAILREQATKGMAARFVKAGRGQFAHRGTV